MIHFSCPRCNGDWETKHYEGCTFAEDCPNEYGDQAILWDLLSDHDSELAALRECVKAADALIVRHASSAEAHATGSHYRVARERWDAARAKVTP